MFVESVKGFVGAFAPEPLSPIFQKGGAMEGYNEDLVFITAFTVILFLVDNIFVKTILKPKARYFALHAFANACVCLWSWPDVHRAVFSDHAYSFSGKSATILPNSIVVAIHFYHCIAFPLRAEDIFHHVSFVSILCGLAIPFKNVYGIANNFGCFFLSGLPGGLDYVLLVFVAQGWLEKETEKIWSVRLNVWLRGPSMTVYAFLGWQTWVHGNFNGANIMLLITSVFLHFTNGQYYTQQAVESLTKYQYRKKHH